MFCFKLKQKHQTRIRMTYFNGDYKPEFGENDHRSPSYRAQGHAYGRNAYGVILPTSRSIQRQSKIPLQHKSISLISQSLTLVRARVQDRWYEFRLSTHPALPLRRWSRAEIGATPLVWGLTCPSSERTLIYWDGRFGCLSHNLCHLGFLFRRHQLY